MTQPGKRTEIMRYLDDAKANGLPFERGCAVLGISTRTIERWKMPKLEEDRKPVRPYNALSPTEVDLVETMIAKAIFADFSVRELSIAALEAFGVYVSPVTFWAYQKMAECNGPRRGRRLPKGAGNKPDTSWVDGPNQLWAWDITHLPTGRPYEFLYLYALEDSFSRKVVAWLIADNLASDKAHELWDLALLNENLLAKPSSMWPTSLSDRGTQMRSHSTRRFFQRLGVAQLFSRPRTPNDNPQIEALFSVTKTEPEYPGFFSTFESAVAYFTDFFLWLNEGHLHTSLGMLTPEQVHSGAGEKILKTRKTVRDETMERRRHFHQTGQEERPDRTAISGRNMPIRFRQTTVLESPDSPKNVPQFLHN